MEQAANEDSREMLSFMWLTRAWILNCTASGVPKTISSRNFYNRIFWLFSVFICFIGFLWQIWSLYEDVYSYPKTVNLQIVHIKELQFPTVTICNSNKFKKSLVEKFGQNTDLSEIAEMDSYSYTIGAESTGYQLLEKLEKFTEKETNDDNETAPLSTCNMERTPGGIKEVDGVYDNSDLYYSKEFQCEDGQCIPYKYVCDEVDDCGFDESIEVCGSCEDNEFDCRSGQCIDAKLRCDSKFDCLDGSDEDFEYCDLEQIRDVFLCCSKRSKVPLNYTCDNYFDCYNDHSDEYLAACYEPIQNNISHLPNVTLLCEQGADDGVYQIWMDYPVEVLDESKLNDGVVDCKFKIDETCAWKNNLSNWVHPSVGIVAYKNYLDMMSVVATNPSKARWFTMSEKEDILKMGHQYEDMIVKCVSQNKPCNYTVSVEETILQDYGNCYSLSQEDAITTSGQDYGLNFWFNLEVYDMLGLFTTTSGLKMFLTPPGLTDYNGNGFVDQSTELNLAPGFEYFVSLHPYKTSKLDAPYSDCEFYKQGRLELFNTQGECEIHCTNKKKWETCGCVDDVSFIEAPLCKLNETEARECVDDLIENLNVGDQCDCPVSCLSTNYETTISKLQWPTKISVSRFTAEVYEEFKTNESVHFMLSILQNNKIDKASDTQIAAKHLRSNFGSVNVFFPDMSETKVEERSIYNFVNVLCNFGGLLGLYLGISVLTVLELVEFLFSIKEYVSIQGKKKEFKKYIESMNKGPAESE